MIWTPAFQQRVLFNASKAFVRQLGKGVLYESLQPVYSLNLVNKVFMPEVPNEFIHNYNVVHEYHSDRVIEGLHLTFVELPKFTPQTVLEKRMAVLWLRFLTEIDENTKRAPESLLADPHTSKALEEVEVAAFTDAQLYAYDRCWDAVLREQMLYFDATRIGRERALKEGLEEGRAEGRAEGLQEGLKEGRAEGLEEGRAEGRAEGLQEGLLTAARNMLAMGMPVARIADATGLPVETIEGLAR